MPNQSTKFHRQQGVLDSGIACCGVTRVMTRFLEVLQDACIIWPIAASSSLTMLNFTTFRAEYNKLRASPLNPNTWTLCTSAVAACPPEVDEKPLLLSLVAGGCVLVVYVLWQN
jgi:hypothetical protein